jgi:predicted Zn-dependent peptidase
VTGDPLKSDEGGGAWRGGAALVACVLLAPVANAAPQIPIDSYEAKFDLPDLPVQTVVLPNGLTVLLAPDANARAISVVTAYGAGSGDDPDNLQGLAHFTEHMVAQRTKHVADAQHALEAAGGTLSNALTSGDTTTYFETLPPGRLETALWIESDRMGFAADAISEERVNAERPIVANESRDRNLDGRLTAAGWAGMHELF